MSATLLRQVREARAIAGVLRGALMDAELELARELRHDNPDYAASTTKICAALERAAKVHGLLGRDLEAIGNAAPWEDARQHGERPDEERDPQPARLNARLSSRAGGAS